MSFSRLVQEGVCLLNLQQMKEQSMQTSLIVSRHDHNSHITICTGHHSFKISPNLKLVTSKKNPSHVALDFSSWILFPNMNICE